MEGQSCRPSTKTVTVTGEACHAVNAVLSDSHAWKVSALDFETLVGSSDLMYFL